MPALIALMVAVAVGMVFLMFHPFFAEIDKAANKQGYYEIDKDNNIVFAKNHDPVNSDERFKNVVFD